MDAHKNFAYSTVAVAPSPASSGTSLTVATGDGALFPATPFNATVWPTAAMPLATNAEVVRVTNIAGDVLTITRAQESSSARTVVIGDQIAATITAKTLTDVESATGGAGTNGAITGGSLTINTSGISINLPAYLTTADLSANSSKYAGINGAITGGSITVNTSGVSVNLPAYLTTAALSGDSSKYAGVNGAITGGSITVNTSGVSVNLPAYLTTAMQSNAATISNINVSVAGSSNNLSAIVFSNSNGFTFGLNAATVTMRGPYEGWIEPMPLSNTTQAGMVAGSFYLAPLTAHNSISGGRVNLIIINTSTAGIFRDFTGASLVSSSTGGQQQGYTYSLVAALFSQGSGTNTTRLESCWSNSFSWGWTKLVSVSLSGASQINVSVAHSISYIADIGSDGAYTLSQFANSTASSVANSSTASNFADSVFVSGRNLVSGGLANGALLIPVGLNTTLSAGNYWMGFAWSTTRSNASTGTQIASALDFAQSSIFAISRIEKDSVMRVWGQTAAATAPLIMPYGAVTGAANMVPPTNIVISNGLATNASQWVPYFNIELRGLKS